MEARKLLGYQSHPDDANLQTLLVGKVRPTPRVHYRAALYNSNSLGILEVFPRRNGPFMADMEHGNMLRRDTIYFRRGSSNDVAQPDDLREIVRWMSAENGGRDGRIGLHGRPTAVPIGGTSLALPCFFPSVSSVKTNLRILEFVRILVSTRHPLFLVSAYDVQRAGTRDGKNLSALLETAAGEHTAIILDSGTYESYWHKDNTWRLKDSGDAWNLTATASLFTSTRENTGL